MSDLQITALETEAKEACDAADAIFIALSSAQRRALAEEINVLFLYLTSQTCNPHPKADPKTVPGRAA